MRSSPRILLKLVKNCGFLFSNLNTFLKSYVMGSSHYIFVFCLFWVPYIDTNPFLPILGSGVIGNLNFVSSTQCFRSNHINKIAAQFYIFYIRDRYALRYDMFPICNVQYAYSNFKLSNASKIAETAKKFLRARSFYMYDL